MEIRIYIEDSTMGRLPWKDMRELIEQEFTATEERTVNQVKLAYQRLGLEVTEDGDPFTPREPSPGN